MVLRILCILCLNSILWAQANAQQYILKGDYNLHNNMYNGNSFDVVDFNQLLTVGEFRFIKMNGSVNGPSTSSSRGYYFGLGGGDVANRGFQLFGAYSELFFRNMETKTWYKLATQDWVNSQISNNSLWAYDSVDGLLKPANQEHLVSVKRIFADEGFAVKNGLGVGRYGLKYGGENEVGAGIHLMLTNREANGHLYLATSPAGGGTDEKIRMTIQSDGKVGIGINNPAYTLDVNGEAQIRGANLYLGTTGANISTSTSMIVTPPTGGFLDIRPSQSNHSLVMRDHTGQSTAWAGMRTLSNGNLQFASASLSNYGKGLVVAANNRVGIGEANPSHALQITADNGFELFRLRRNYDTGNDLTIDVASGSGLANIVAGAQKTVQGTAYKYTGTRGASRIQLTDGAISLYTSDKVNGEGVENSPVNWHNPINLLADKVGIGTTTPQEKLHVEGSMQLGQIGITPIINSSNRNLEVRSKDSGKRTVLNLIPNGAITTSPSALSLFGTDYAADATNWERLIFRAKGSSDNAYQIRTEADGSGQIHPLHLSTGPDNTGIFITPDAKVGIGTTNPYSKLAVAGEIRAVEVNVMPDIAIPDYVFEPDYELRPLPEVEAYVQQHKHLPEIPSAAEIGANGMHLGEMNALLLKKIEELTLYQIEQHNTLEQQNALLQQLLRENKVLLERVEELEGKD